VSWVGRAISFASQFAVVTAALTVLSIVGDVLMGVGSLIQGISAAFKLKRNYHELVNARHAASSIQASLKQQCADNAGPWKVECCRLNTLVIHTLQHMKAANQEKVRALKCSRQTNVVEAVYAGLMLTSVIVTAFFPPFAIATIIIGAAYASFRVCKGMANASRLRVAHRYEKTLNSRAHLSFSYDETLRASAHAHLSLSDVQAIQTNRYVVLHALVEHWCLFPETTEPYLEPIFGKLSVSKAQVQVVKKMVRTGAASKEIEKKLNDMLFFGVSAGAARAA
jgi:hypothetical protein